MIADIINNLIKPGFTAVYNWMSILENRVQLLTYLLGAIFSILVIRFLIMPFLKSGLGSDKVGKGKNKKNSKNSSNKNKGK